MSRKILIEDAYDRPVSEPVRRPVLDAVEFGDGVAKPPPPPPDRLLPKSLSLTLYENIGRGPGVGYIKIGPDTHWGVTLAWGTEQLPERTCWMCGVKHIGSGDVVMFVGAGWAHIKCVNLFYDSLTTPTLPTADSPRLMCIKTKLFEGLLPLTASFASSMGADATQVWETLMSLTELEAETNFKYMKALIEGQFGTYEKAAPTSMIKLARKVVSRGIALPDWLGFYVSTEPAIPSGVLVPFDVTMEAIWPPAVR